MRESKLVLYLHCAAATALLMAPAMVIEMAPEFAARFSAWLDTMPYLVTCLLCFVWLLAIIGCLWPPYQVMGRWFWGLGVAGLIAFAFWLCVADVVNDAGIIPVLGEMGSDFASVVWGLLFCLCVAGMIFDGSKQRRDTTTPGGEARK